VVEGEQGRAVRRLGEPLFQPGALRLAEPAVRLAGDRAVERDQADRQIVDHIAERTRRGALRDLGKAFPDQLAVVMIAGDRVAGKGGLLEQCGQDVIGRGIAVIGEVARDQEGIGGRIHGADLLQAAHQVAMGVDLAEGENARRQKVEVGDLDKLHQSAPGVSMAGVSDRVAIL
jgi:hypothetical protein